MRERGERMRVVCLLFVCFLNSQRATMVWEKCAAFSWTAFLESLSKQRNRCQLFILT